jgi:AraC-like DNA-binding protein
LAQPLTLASLARELAMSETTLIRAFRAGFGCSIHQYVLDRRLMRAKSLLADRDVSIAEVADRSGFSDQSHLTRFFRRAFDTTPAAWRRAEFGG